MRALKVDALTGCVGGEQHLNVGIVQESLLRLATLVTSHTAVDQNHCRRPPEEGADLPLEVDERVPMLGEDHEFLSWRGYRFRDRPRGVGRGGLGHPTADPGGCEDLTE